MSRLVSSTHSPATAIQELIQAKHADIYTAMPGIIISYDPETKRADIQPALNAAYPDTIQRRAPTHNVPVLFPAGGGFAMQFPLRAGDAVLVVYSMRGTTNFRETFDVSDPDPHEFVGPNSPIAIAGFGSLEIAVPEEGAATLQSEDGERWIGITDSGITVESGEDRIALSDSGIEITTEGDLSIKVGGDINIESEKMRHNKRNVGGDHLHRYIRPLHPTPGPPREKTTKPDR